MSVCECASSSTDAAEREVTLSSKAVLADLHVVQILIDEVITAPTTEERENAVSSLQQFVIEWREALESLERNQPQDPEERPNEENDRRLNVSFWSRLFGVKCRTPSQKSMSTRQAASSSTESSSCSQYDVSSAAGKAVSCTTSKSVIAESSEHNALTAIPALTDAESEEEQETPPSLRLMTCESLKDGDSLPSIVLKSTAVVAYGPFESYRLQTVDETPAMSDPSQEGDKADTAYSTAPVSSHHASASVVEMSKDDAPATRVENQVTNYENREAFMQKVLEQITAVFEGSEHDLADGSGGLGVEILEVASCDEHDAVPVPPAGGEREEVKSLRSTRRGIVRRMVDVFSRFKS